MSNTNKNIVELLEGCYYNPSFKDYIIKILIELSCQRGVVFFKTVSNGNKIVAIKYPMTIRLKGNPYEIKIIIFIISEFPDKAPEIYIDSSNDPSLAVNPKNPNVNQENFRVTTNKLFNWVKSTSIQEILTEIINSFELNFPIYKKKPGQQNPQPMINPNQSMHSNGNPAPPGFINGQGGNVSNANNMWNFFGGNNNIINKVPINNNTVQPMNNFNNFNINQNNPSINNNMSNVNNINPSMFNSGGMQMNNSNNSNTQMMDFKRPSIINF